MRREIDQDGTMAIAPPPGPLVDADRLEGWRGWDRSPPHQAEQRGRTDREPQTSREPGAGLAPKARPMARSAVMSRWVLRACVATKSGRRSVKMRRGQAAFRHMNFHTVSYRRTARGPQGKSVRRRR